MFAHGFFVVAQEVGNIGNWHTSLQQDSRER
jgi:hypothetical protein